MELISDAMHKYHCDERGSDVLPHPANYFFVILSYLKMLQLRRAFVALLLFDFELDRYTFVIIFLCYLYNHSPGAHS
jgi:hypothetical protein